MNENMKKERLLELLADKAIFGLDADDARELETLSQEFPEFRDDHSLESAAAAVNLNAISEPEELPANLRSKILTESRKHVASAKITPVKPVETAETETPQTPFWQWLTPVFAGIGCLALLANIWISYTRESRAVVNGKDPRQIEKPVEPSIGEKRNKLLASSGIIKTEWQSPTDDPNLKGEVVWSDEKQEGYMTFKGLAKNDVSKETYQLWMFRDASLEPHPVDGGVFDISDDGEVIVPIDAKLNVKNPAVFAVTVEKPGGVVVSKREKIIALAKTST